VERKIDEDKVDRDEYEAYLEDLQDVSDNAEPIEAEFEEGVRDDDETDLDDESSDEDAEEDEASDQTE
jgi:hypothetical protein